MTNPEFVVTILLITSMYARQLAGFLTFVWDYGVLT